MRILPCVAISIHALHEESDPQALLDGQPKKTISIHALHEESDLTVENLANGIVISIHALHEESDQVNALCDVGMLISIHALHEESDLKPQRRRSRHS